MGDFFVVYFGIMKASFAREIDHFAMFLENHDGESYNKLMQSLSWIYNEINEASLKGGTSFAWSSSYFNAAIFECAQFVAKHFGVFWSKYCNERELFLAHKNEIISVVAYRFAQYALSEFKLGNVCETA